MKTLDIKSILVLFFLVISLFFGYKWLYGGNSESRKRVKELDPSWEFNDPYNHYIFRILILLDALDVDETFSLEKHGKICQMMHREVRDIRRINSLWRMNTSLVVEFINSTPLKEEDREREKDKLPENLVDKEGLSPCKSTKTLNSS
jgi:hypothetical protein